VVGTPASTIEALIISLFAAMVVARIHFSHDRMEWLE
jgi:hypothetical protein